MCYDKRRHVATCHENFCSVKMLDIYIYIYIPYLHSSITNKIQTNEAKTCHGVCRFVAKTIYGAFIPLHGVGPSFGRIFLSLCQRSRRARRLTKPKGHACCYAACVKDILMLVHLFQFNVYMFLPKYSHTLASVNNF